MSSGDGTAEPRGKWDIPAAFYRDDPPAIPPPGDPHRVEFDVEGEFESVPDWVVWALPVGALVVLALHFAVALLVYTLVR